MVDQRTVAKTFGYVFVAIGVLGFVPNPLVSADGLFQVNATHNIVHLLSGIVALVAGYERESHARTYNSVSGPCTVSSPRSGSSASPRLPDMLGLSSRREGGSRRPLPLDLVNIFWPTARRGRPWDRKCSGAPV
ncbi:hypothetical protein BRD56_02265 [Thermoplasmatales archaeon SW_10_69_26]|nr:MAG: hypothetical protein BRD56_02265 [Thermoplasmatales archaeon SW_10_69_26]